MITALPRCHIEGPLAAPSVPHSLHPQSPTRCTLSSPLAVPSVPHSQRPLVVPAATQVRMLVTSSHPVFTHLVEQTALQTDAAHFYRGEERISDVEGESPVPDGLS